MARVPPGPTVAESSYVQIRERLGSARRRGVAVLSEPDAKAVLALGGITVPGGGFAETAADAVKVASRLTAPLVVKVVSPGLLHKTDLGGVELGVRGEAEVVRACERIASRVREASPAATVSGFLVEEMAPVAIEIVASVTRDPRLGRVMMVGLGGVWVEVLRDVAFRLVPADRMDVDEMLDELRGAALLGAARGRGPVDRDALVTTLLSLSALGERLDADVEEIEINPLALSSSGAVALDAVVSLSRVA
jgi:succinyl-CoA synthetase beta subunit